MVAGSKALFLARREYEPEVLDALIVRAATKNAIRGLPDDRGRTANRLLFVPSRVDRAEDALEQQAEDESAWNESEDGVQVRADKFHFQI